ncbi:MAG: hypothetical protein MUC29_04255 [Pyrinomonadaceae bacterium]|jgi:hypothetical protein|nr:hypothetical protein [Pyrinomonadaceae bacterium]
MLKTILAILTISVLLLSGCTPVETGNIKDVTQSEIYQNYSFRSDGASTTATAKLSFAGANGTTLKLTNPSKVLFNNQPLDEKTGTYTGTYYEKRFETVLSDGSFTFTDTKGKTYTNKIEMPTIDFKTSPTAINRSTITRIPVLNGNKIANSSVNIEIEYENKQGFQSKNVPVFPQKQDANSAYFDAKTNSIVIEPSIWQGINANKIELQITSKSETKPQQGTNIGGKISAEYIGKKIYANLVGKNMPTSAKTVNANVNNITNANVAKKTNVSNVKTNANVENQTALKPISANVNR